MNFFEKLLKVLMDNLIYTIALTVSIILFAIFSNGLIPGIITAASALIAYICIKQLYSAFPKKNSGKRK